jgi:hypothetical protein
MITFAKSKYKILLPLFWGQRVFPVSIYETDLGH